MNCVALKNNQVIPLSSIPELDYESFLEQNVLSLMKDPRAHCINYFGYPFGRGIRLICCIANDESHSIFVSSSIASPGQTLSSFSFHDPAFEKFEREIHENFGIEYIDHPWLKPVRFAFDRSNQKAMMANYPFFKIESEELHEVGVGPIHAGIIEPGHFRFICNGEQILHLETQLGYQHRGIERLFTEKKKLLQLITLAENIAGDSVAAHTVSFVNCWETLCNYSPRPDLQFARTLALELERIAIHTGDLGALCADVAYQLGSSVFGRLRTPIINYFQAWCGNRLAKGLIRAGKNNYPLTGELAGQLMRVLDAFEPDFNAMCEELFSLPSALARFEKTGVVSAEQAAMIGTVGMTARASGISRDIRSSHPHDLYPELEHHPIVKAQGDVYARARIRKKEIRQSIGYLRQLIQKMPGESADHKRLNTPLTNSFAISLVEGWRGEVCHCAITGHTGELILYKVKDPSFHNWLALALAVRNNEISDFPVCNKSFDLSYCGHDL